MAFHFAPDGGPLHRPFDTAAASIKPWEFSKVLKLTIDEWRCPSPGCNATADYMTVEPDLWVRCYAQHRSSFRHAFNETNQRVQRAAKRMGRKP